VLKSTLKYSYHANELIRHIMPRHALLLAWLCLAAHINALSPPPLHDVLLPTIEPRRSLVPRQSGVLTRTLTPTETATDVLETSASTSDEPTRTVPSLTPADTPIPLAATIGLIMPNPWTNLYAGDLHTSTSLETRADGTGVNYSFGFVDAARRPAPTIGGWIRHVQPLLVFANYTVGPALLCFLNY
jgi:hypothetical protein